MNIHFGHKKQSSGASGDGSAGQGEERTSLHTMRSDLESIEKGEGGSTTPGMKVSEPIVSGAQMMGDDEEFKKSPFFSEGLSPVKSEQSIAMALPGIPGRFIGDMAEEQSAPSPIKMPETGFRDSIPSGRLESIDDDSVSVASDFSGPASGVGGKKPAGISGLNGLGDEFGINNPMTGDVDMIEESPRKGVNWKVVMISMLVITVLLGGAGAGYYFFIVKSAETPASIEQVAVPEQKITPKEQATEYFLSTPNYLVMDLNVVSVANVSKKIQDILPKLPEINKGVFEFVMTDSNRSNIALGKFLEMSGMSLGTEVTSALTDKFSLFVYEEGQNKRLAIALEVIPEEKERLKSAMMGAEGNLPSALSFMFLGQILEKKEGTFADGKYENIAIRYLNLDPAKGLSIDYAIAGKYLIIGTSKDSTRAVIDKLERSETTQQENTQQ